MPVYHFCTFKARWRSHEVFREIAILTHYHQRSAAIFRALVPESAQFRIVKECEETISHQSGAALSTVATGGSTLPPAATTKRQLLRHRLVTFCRHLKTMMRLEWKIFVYTIIFVAVGVWYASAVVRSECLLLVQTVLLLIAAHFHLVDYHLHNVLDRRQRLQQCRRKQSKHDHESE